MVIEYRFDPENFNYSEAWELVTKEINVEKIGDKIKEYYEKTRGITYTEEAIYKKVLDILETNKELQQVEKQYDTWEFDVRKLKTDDRMNFLRIQGLIYEKLSFPHADGRKTIQLNFEDKDKYEYMLENLSRKDVKKRKSDDHIFRMTIRNPAFAYYFYHELPSLTKKEEDELFKGVITGAAIKTVKEEKRDVITFITRNQTVFEEIEMVSALRKLWDMSTPYDDINGGKIKKVYSLFFLKPTELSSYILDDDRFRYIPDKLKDLTDFTDDIINAYRQATLLKRVKIYNSAKARGKLDNTEYKQRLEQFYESKKELRELKALERNILKKQGTLEYFHDRDKIDSELDAIQDQIRKVEELNQKLDESLFTSKRGTGKNKRITLDRWADYKAKEQYGK